MAPPGNGIFVVRGEMAILMTAMKRGHRWSSASYHEEQEQDGLMRQFTELKAQLAHIEDLRLVEPMQFLGPFLDVVRSEETTGPITSLALSTINKFLAYGLIDPTHPALPATVESIADAVTHARFVGTDQTSDGVVLMKIVQVLRTLMLNPEGSVLSNESVCEVMLSCFRICFEGRLSELLCQTAEHALRDIVLLLFMRLPQFAEERSAAGLVRRLKMMSGGVDAKKGKGKGKAAAAATAAATAEKTSKPASRKTSLRKASTASTSSSATAAAVAAATATEAPAPAADGSSLLAPPKTAAAGAILSTTPATPLGNIVDMQGKMLQTTPLSSTSTAASASAATPADETDAAASTETTTLLVVEPQSQSQLQQQCSMDNDADVEDDGDSVKDVELQAAAVAFKQQQREDFINSMGVRFTPVSESESSSAPAPYGLPCVRELLRFLISLCNPLDKQNTDRMMHIGLSLLTVALEVGADHIGNYESLMALVKDDMCRNLFALLNQERLSIFAADLQVCFLLFESLRSDLKFHLEFYLARLFDIVAGENARITYEKRELALDNILQFCRIPGFAAELYINYDCNLYSSDLLEHLVQLLSKITLSASGASGAQQPLYSVHQMSLDGLLTIVRGIERNCAASKTISSAAGVAGQKSKAAAGGRHSRNGSSTTGNVLDIVGGSLASGAMQVEQLAGGMASGNESSGVENVSSFSSVTAALTAASSKRQAGDAKQLVTPQQLQEIKRQKRILTQGTELFNQRPDKGIQYLQENGLLQAQLDPAEVARFLRDNAGLDKAMIGEYISKKKNVELRILENFVNSFDFTQTRIDLALRQYLETFRLPGEAPLIFLVMEHFAEHWHKCNNEPFENTDAAFRLAYAIIMLNMDQHNYNAKRLNIPMTAEDFMKNLRGLNGTADFDQQMLADIYNGIKSDEIIMPAEQTGLVRENYLWKVLLRRGITKDARFTHVADAQHDRQLFQLVWGPTLSAISYVFDKTATPDATGLRSGAIITAHYSLHADFDGLILTLCKFSGLLTSTAGGSTAIGADASSATSAYTTAAHNPNADIATAVAFAQNPRAQLALHTVFGILHEHGDCARDGWRPALDVCVQLFRAKLLPRQLTEVDDYCEPSGRVQLAAEKPPPKPADAGIFSSLYSYLASDGLGRQPTYEEQEHIRAAKRVVRDCHIDRLISDSRFVQFEALQELLAACGAALRAPTAHKSLGQAYAEEAIVFQMELMVKVLVQNRDRVLPVWQPCRDQMYALLAGAASCGYAYLLGRATVALLKLGIYLMRNEELCSTVLQSLRMLLALKPAVIHATSKQISIGIYELLKTSAQNIHTEADWEIVFTLLECVGAGAIPPEADEGIGPPALQKGAKSEGAVSSEDETLATGRGYTSDSEVAKAALQQQQQQQRQQPPENWILVNKDAASASDSSTGSSSADCNATTTQVSCPSSPTATVARVSLTYPCRLLRHSPFALVKCWESLAFIVRNVAHITPYNFESCVRCIRTFVEAALNVGGTSKYAPTAGAALSSNGRRPTTRREHQPNSGQYNHGADAPEQSDESLGNAASDGDNDTESANNDLTQRYELIAEQLLDLMHTLHTRTAQIFRWWAEEGGVQTAQTQQTSLWAHGWCPLLQGIARLVNDRRREVRTHAIEYLQRALLVHDLQALSGPEWQSCFRQVIFPLLYDLLAETAPGVEAGLLDESRIRTATIMWKVFLHHLTPLIALPGFGELWLEILDYMERFMGVGSDMLHEAMREGLKNMLLVVNMHPVRVFHSNAALWGMTMERIGQFMPQLKDELFKDKANQQQSTEITRSEAINNAQQTAASTAPAAQAQETQHAPDVQSTESNPQQVEARQQVVESAPSHAELKPHPIGDSARDPLDEQLRQQQQHQPQAAPQQHQHIPYLVSQAQQQFALMEQQYHQQYQQHQPQPGRAQPELIHPNNEFTVTLDMGDSEPEQYSPPIAVAAAQAAIENLTIQPTATVPETQNAILPGHSFAPTFVQPPQLQRQSIADSSVSDIYSEYVQNPYNLVQTQTTQSHVADDDASVPIDSTATAPDTDPAPSSAAPLPAVVANVFQSANYFGNEAPGSEALFGAP